MRGRSLTHDEMLDLLDSLLRDLPALRRERARRRLLEILRQVYAECGAVPEWIRVGQERWGTPGG
ncbi:MAG TPA: hypothetical protein VHG51_15145 [Longimicrobiaceae bacterium]|nr:hypothetical protein [Longimicrobiaceae bacterium]